MTLPDIIDRALNASRETLEGEETVVLKFIGGFAEHPLAGLAGAVLFDRESEGLPEGQIPRGFVRRADFERSLKPIIEREQWKANKPVWRSKSDPKPQKQRGRRFVTDDLFG